VAKKGKKAQPDAHQKHVLHEEHEAHLRGWAIGDLLPVCAAEAVAMSLRLAGQRVSEDEVAGLHWAAGGDVRRPVSIAAALAAARSGLAGCVPALDEQVFADFADDLAALDLGRRFNEQPVGRDAAKLKPLVDLVVDRPFAHALILGVGHAQELGRGDDAEDEDRGARHLIPAADGYGCGADPHRDNNADQRSGNVGYPALSRSHALILGVNVPGPHCVLATPGGWWSWGRLWDPWPCAIEEAWAVTWS
jgi:hypothetical protein